MGYAINESVRNGLEKQSFERLENQARSFRETGQRTPDGRSSLDIFYTSMMWFSVYGGEGDERSKVTRRWMSLYPKSPTPYIAHAIQLINEAGGIKQSVFANEQIGVTGDKETAEKRAAEKYLEARALLQKTKSIASQDPFYGFLMIELAGLTAKTDDAKEKAILAALDEAANQKHVLDSIYEQAAYRLLPIWQDDKARLEAFVRRNLERLPAADRAMIYARIYWRIAMQSNADLLFKNWAVDWPLFKQGMNDILVRYPDNWNGAWLAHFACIAGDKEQTRRVWSMAEALQDRDIWPSPFTFYGCRAVAQADERSGTMLTGPDALNAAKPDQM